MDWTPVIQAALALLAALLAVLAETTRRWISERRHAGRVEGVKGAVLSAAGLVLNELARSPVTQAGLDKLIREGAAYVVRSYPDTVQKLGVREDHLAEMVRAQVGLLRAPKSGGT